jgi:hypothetical protein
MHRGAGEWRGEHGGGRWGARDEGWNERGVVLISWCSSSGMPDSAIERRWRQSGWLSPLLLASLISSRVHDWTVVVWWREEIDPEGVM